jgi:hypothetical protein
MTEDSYSHSWGRPTVRDEWQPVVLALDATTHLYGSANDDKDLALASRLLALNFPGTVGRLSHFTSHGRYESFDLEVRVSGVFALLLSPGPDSHVGVRFAAFLGPARTLMFQSTAECVPLATLTPALKARFASPDYPRVALTKEIDLHMPDRVWEGIQESERLRYTFLDDEI